MIEEFQPQAIWSTYPIATTHLIAAELQERSGLPWIADFRDPMAQSDYPADPLDWQSYKEEHGINSGPPSATASAPPPAGSPAPYVPPATPLVPPTTAEPGPAPVTPSPNP